MESPSTAAHIPANMLDWQPDILEGYEQARLDPAVMVRRSARPPTPRAVVLMVHGYNDYFFQTHTATEFADAGYVVYGVDLRRAGRALRAGDRAHDMADIAEPGDDIAAAADAVVKENPDLPLVVYAHSTGGLTASIWAADRPHPALAALVLNGPLFGLRYRRSQQLGLQFLPLLMRVRPHAIVSQAPSLYSQRLLVGHGGRWEFDTTWKTPRGVPTTASWINAVRRAQRRIRRGLGIQVPVLVARAASTGPEREDNPLFDAQDVVTDVEACARLAPLLGTHVDALAVEGAIHDLALSADGPRTEFFTHMFAWLHKELP